MGSVRSDWPLPLIGWIMMTLGKDSMFSINRKERVIASPHFLFIVYRYISKENLRDLLGDAFPEEEIDSILKEAASSKYGITYEDFLTQWNHDKEGFMREWSEHAVPKSIEAESEQLGSSPHCIRDLLLEPSSDMDEYDFLQGKACFGQKVGDFSCCHCNLVSAEKWQPTIAVLVEVLDKSTEKQVGQKGRRM